MTASFRSDPGQELASTIRERLDRRIVWIATDSLQLIVGLVHFASADTQIELWQLVGEAADEIDKHVHRDPSRLERLIQMMLTTYSEAR